MANLLKGAIVLTLVFILCGGFIWPAMIIFLAWQIIKFGGVIMVLDVACRLVFHMGLAKLVAAGLDRIDKHDQF